MMAPDCEPSPAQLSEGAHTLSEWLNDNAPIGEKRYEKALEAALLSMRQTPADAPVRRLFLMSRDRLIDLACWPAALALLSWLAMAVLRGPGA